MRCRAVENGQVRWAGQNTCLCCQDPGPATVPLLFLPFFEVRENETGGVFVEGLKTVDVADPSEVSLLKFF